MDKSTWYWLVMFLLVVFGAAGSFAGDNSTVRKFQPAGWSLMIFLLFLLLGLSVFGDAIK